MYRSILVPLDGSLPSEQSLPYAATLARCSGAALQLAYVHTPLLLGEGTLYLATPDVQLWDEEKKYLLSIVDRLKKAGLEKVSAHVLEGPIAETLQEYALGEGSDLIVMTTHGRGPVSRFWLGSVADQLVHRLPIPLLLIRTREETPPPAGEPEARNVLVALDGTPIAEQILQPAGGLAKMLGASLTLLRVLPSVVPNGTRKQAVPDGLCNEIPENGKIAKIGNYLFSPDYRFPELRCKAVPDVLLVDTLRSEANFYLQRVADSLREEGFAVQTRIIAHAHPATAILNEAASGEYDLLALETHGRRGLPRLFLGSIADKVVRGATIPVLVHRCLPD